MTKITCVEVKLDICLIFKFDFDSGPTKVAREGVLTVRVDGQSKAHG